MISSKNIYSFFPAAARETRETRKTRDMGKFITADGPPHHITFTDEFDEDETTSLSLETVEGQELQAAMNAAVKRGSTSFE